MTPNTISSSRPWLFAATFFFAAAAPIACGDNNEDECMPGTNTCACAAGNLCFNGLQCLSNFCVIPGSTSGKPTTTMPSTTAEPETSGEPTTGGSDTTPPEPGGPEFVQFLTNVTEITEGESVVFTALLTDPDGAADVIGGSLTNPDGTISFGAFVSTGQPGSFEFTLSWAAIHQADAIEFETPSAVRTFRAEFFDQMGKSAAKTADITLQCDDGLRFTPAACGGVCTDLNDDDANCASCGHACEVRFDSGYCENSACTPVLTGCFKYGDYPTCYAYCLDKGETCVVGGCNNQTSGELSSCEDDWPSYNYDHPCTDMLADSYSTCCCTQENI